MSCTAGELDDVTLSELIKQPDVRAVIDLLATWGVVYAKPLTEKYREFIERADLAILECALDKYYYQQALESVKKRSYNNSLTRDILMTEIDVVNLKTILRMVRDHVEGEHAQEFLIDGGKEFDLETLHHFISFHRIEEVLKELEQTPFRFLADVPEVAIKTQKISVLEKQLEKFLIRRGASTFFKRPFKCSRDYRVFLVKI